MDEFVDAGPTAAMSLTEYANQQGARGYGSNSIVNWGYNTFGNGKAIKEGYQTYLDNLANKNEWRATQSARAWDEYLLSTQVQRTMKDIEKAGLNPWLALQNGISTSGASSSQKADYKFSKREEKEGSGGKTLALFLLAAARLIGAVI